MIKIINVRKTNAYDLEGITSMTPLREGVELHFGGNSYHQTILAVNLKKRTITTGVNMPGDTMRIVDYQLLGNSPFTICETHAKVISQDLNPKLYEQYSKIMDKIK